MFRSFIGLFTLVLAYASAYADHGDLRKLSPQLTAKASILKMQSEKEIGEYPTYGQRYAQEHLQFFAESAAQLERTIFFDGPADDHAKDSRIVQAFRKVEHDVYYARTTFRDLFNGNSDDHSQLERLLIEAEDLVPRIRNVLPPISD